MQLLYFDVCGQNDGHGQVSIKIEHDMMKICPPISKSQSDLKSLILI